MQEPGKQYKRDDMIDKSGFLRRARKHQSEFRAKKLELPYDGYGNYLTSEDGAKGSNFFDGFGIFEAVKRRYKRYNRGLYANMLRSEHIPFNLFIPFNLNDDSRIYCAKVLNEFLEGSIKSVDRIEIEYAPEPKEQYLDDKTSFDAYIEYTHIDNTKGIIGIEVKYTEQGYKLDPKSSQAEGLTEGTSKYFPISDSCNLYVAGTIKELVKDDYRQIWRNHLLGERILVVDSSKFKHFTSLTLFPEGNTHFLHTSKAYINMLIANNNNFSPVTYELFFEACRKHNPNRDYERWTDYLTERYIVANQ